MGWHRDDEDFWWVTMPTKTEDRADKKTTNHNLLLEDVENDEEPGLASAPQAGTGLKCSVCGADYRAPRHGQAEYVCLKCALDVPARERVCAICGSRVTDHYAADGLRLCAECAEELE